VLWARSQDARAGSANFAEYVTTQKTLDVTTQDHDKKGRRKLLAPGKRLVVQQTTLGEPSTTIKKPSPSGKRRPLHESSPHLVDQSGFDPRRGNSFTGLPRTKLVWQSEKEGRVFQQYCPVIDVKVEQLRPKEKSKQKLVQRSGARHQTLPKDRIARKKKREKPELTEEPMADALESSLPCRDRAACKMTWIWSPGHCALSSGGMPALMVLSHAFALKPP